MWDSSTPPCKQTENLLYDNFYTGVDEFKEESLNKYDNNKKAVQQARFNAKLNQVGERVDFQYADILAGVENKVYNLIAFNAPTVPTPPNFRQFLHSDGGRYGDELTSQALDQIVAYMGGDTKVVFSSYTLGEINFKETILFQKLRERYRGASVRVTHPDPGAWHYHSGNEQSGSNNPIPLEEFARRFGANASPGWYENSVVPWIRELATEGCTHIHHVICEMLSGDFAETNRARSQVYRF